MRGTKRLQLLRSSQRSAEALGNFPCVASNATIAKAFRDTARADGYVDPHLAEAYVAGRLGRRCLPPGLPAEPVPASPSEANALARRYRLDAWALWWVLYVREPGRTS